MSARFVKDPGQFWMETYSRSIWSGVDCNVSEGVMTGGGLGGECLGEMHLEVEEGGDRWGGGRISLKPDRTSCYGEDDFSTDEEIGEVEDDLKELQLVKDLFEVHDVLRSWVEKLNYWGSDSVQGVLDSVLSETGRRVLSMAFTLSGQKLHLTGEDIFTCVSKPILVLLTAEYWKDDKKTIEFFRFFSSFAIDFLRERCIYIMDARMQHFKQLSNFEKRRCKVTKGMFDDLLVVFKAFYKTVTLVPSFAFENNAKCRELVMECRELSRGFVEVFRSNLSLSNTRIFFMASESYLEMSEIALNRCALSLEELDEASVSKASLTSPVTTTESPVQEKKSSEHEEAGSQSPQSLVFYKDIPLDHDFEECSRDSSDVSELLIDEEMSSVNSTSSHERDSYFDTSPVHSAGSAAFRKAAASWTKQKWTIDLGLIEMLPNSLEGWTYEDLSDFLGKHSQAAVYEEVTIEQMKGLPEKGMRFQIRLSNPGSDSSQTCNRSNGSEKESSLSTVCEGSLVCLVRRQSTYEIKPAAKGIPTLVFGIVTKLDDEVPDDDEHDQKSVWIYPINEESASHLLSIYIDDIRT